MIYTFLSYSASFRSLFCFSNRKICQNKFSKFICRKLFDARKARSPMQILFRPKQVTWSCQQAFRIDRSVGISVSAERLFDARESRSQLQVLCVLSSLEPSLWLVIAILNRGRPHGSNHCGCGCGSPEDLPIYFFQSFSSSFWKTFWLSESIDLSESQSVHILLVLPGGPPEAHALQLEN